MKITWLGQSGARIETDDGRVLFFDPYLSDSLGKNQPPLHRILPIEEAYLEEKIDAILISHDHTDHMDPDTLKVLFGNPENNNVIILSSRGVWHGLRGFCPNSGNSFCMEAGAEMTLWGRIRVQAVEAFHSDPHAVSFIIEADNCRIYLSGDTLYSRRISEEIGEPVDIAMICINGAGNNMNALDAARLAADIRPKVAVPVHWDMLPGYTADPLVFEKEASERGIKCLIMEEYEEYSVTEILDKQQM